MAGLGERDAALGQPQAELERETASPRFGQLGMLERHWNWFRALLIPVIVLGRPPSLPSGGSLALDARVARPWS